MAADPLPSWKEQRQLHRQRNRARNRLLSIQYDVDNFLKPLMEHRKLQTCLRKWPLFANQRCGAWYAYPFTRADCYFKSADGHRGSWKLSLKRLNLHVIKAAAHTGGCFLIDASHTKVMPDSFTRTVPIWAAVMNRWIWNEKKKRKQGFNRSCELLQSNEEETDDERWQEVYAPDCFLEPNERDHMRSLLDERVRELCESQAILEPDELARVVKKPLRAFWVTEPDTFPTDELVDLGKHYLLLVCISCSRKLKGQDQTLDLDFLYSPGAGDDEEAWSLGLTPDCFWKNRHTILQTEGAQLTADETDAAIITTVERYKRTESFLEGEDVPYHALGGTNISLGSRRAGRPPICWENFDAVLNVTMDEYDGMQNVPNDKFYLQLPVAEGKRDKTNLERWLAVGLTFVALHATSHRHVLIHCAQGKDRSAAIAIAFFVLFVVSTENESFIIRSHLGERMADLFSQATVDEMDLAPSNGMYKQSGLSNEVVQTLMGRSGRTVFLEWYTTCFPPLQDEASSRPVADKHAMRLAMHTVERYRSVISPTRSTMQKLNRFFMSAEFEKKGN